MKSPIIAAVCCKQTPRNKKATPYLTNNKLNFTVMKQKSYSVLIAFIIVLSSCSKEDEFKTIAPASIAFVHADGSALLQGECINPKTNYAVLIKTNSEGSGIFKSTKVEYTLNGVPFIMSFMSDGQQLNPIKLIDGENKAEIVGTTYKAYLSLNTNTNFELVE
jgi:hypothetical protein